MLTFFEKFLVWVKKRVPSTEEIKCGEVKSDVKKSYKIGQDLYLKIRLVPGNLTIEAYSTLKRLREFPNGGPHFINYEAVEKICTQHSDRKQYYGLKWIYHTNEPRRYVQCVVHWLLENFNDDWHGTGIDAGSNSYTRYREPLHASGGAGGAGAVPGGAGADRRMRIEFLLNPCERPSKRPCVIPGQI